jgi:hypothetical protein
MTAVNTIVLKEVILRGEGIPPRQLKQPVVDERALGVYFEISAVMCTLF